MSIDSEIVYKKFEKRLNLDFSPEVNKNGIDNSDWRLAELLRWHNQFYKDILEIRSKANITPVEYPKKITTDELVELIGKTAGDKLQIIIDECDKLRKKYRLTENWYMSMVSAVVTHTILVPSNFSIGIHMPELLSHSVETEKNKPKSIKDIARSIFEDPALQKTQRALRLYGYPAIYFTRQTTIDELKKWINKNRNILRYMMNNLPKKKTIKRNQNTLLWGQTVWILKQDGVKSYTKMTEIIQGWLDKEVEHGTRIDDDITIAPNPEELEKYYKRFIESLSSIEPKT